MGWVGKEPEKHPEEDGPAAQQHRFEDTKAAARRALEEKLNRLVTAGLAKDAAGESLDGDRQPEEGQHIPPDPPPTQPPGTIPLRGEMFQPQAAGLHPYPKPLPELQIEREEPTPADGETQTLLNAIIGECHFLMREVIFRSICHSRDLEDRMGWLNASMRLAETGAKVGDSVAKLRSGPVSTETRQRLIVEHVNRTVGGGGAASP